jgi:Tol biopolymer transport system component/predicted Ser/Thr protein kinase
MSDWAEVERAMAAALELPETERAAYLAQQPAEIRAEVESLLEAHKRAGSFLGKSGERVYPQQIGPFRLEGLIGEGGMGVVYRALDTKLNRPAAVKFLYEDLADSAARRRFQREAQMASSLNHPHILTVYDAGDFEGRQYLVTEFIDGGTLKDWARSEKRTWREIVALLVGVADGLAAAHAAGILHRDIKPDNILVGKNGYAKLSDFGLAKLEERTSSEDVTKTFSSKRTGPGVILGTIGYMSPEQASGKLTDARSDIFAFGVVLYELLAGRRPFEGASDLEVLQTIIHGVAPPLAADVPLPLQMIVEKALEKAPADRYQSTRDLVVDLRRLARQTGETAGSSVTAQVAARPTRMGNRRKLAIAAAAAAVLAGIIGVLRPPPAAEAPRQVVQFDINPQPGTIFAPPINRQPFAISPDGKRLAFTATGANGTNIWVRDLSALDMHVVPGTEGAWSVFWSPDSRSLYFTVGRVFKQANLETGSGATVAELPFLGRMGTWRKNGDLLLLMMGGAAELGPRDGSLRKALVDDEVRWPQFLPGSDRLVYAASDPSAQTIHAMVADYGGGKPVTLMETGSRVQYAPPRRAGEPGYLIFIRGGSLLAQPFDADRLRLAGESFPIAQNVLYYGSTLGACFSVSENGVLVYQAGFPKAELKWYDRGGHEVGTAGRPAPYWGQVRVSRDGQRVAATVWSPEKGGTDVWIFDADGRESRQFTFPPEVGRRPLWSPDGKRLAIGRSPLVGPSKLAILDIGGGNPQQFEGESQPFVLPTDWSGDGRFIAIDTGIGLEVRGTWIADTSTGKFTQLSQNKFLQWGTAFSPDGRQIAFASVESGRPEVYVQAFEPGPSPHTTGERRQVSRGGGWLVRWRADGRELFYVGLDNDMYAVPVKGPVEFGDPESLFRIPGTPQYGTSQDFQFDVSPNGQRFIIPTTGSVAPPPFTVIENWQDKFKK